MNGFTFFRNYYEGMSKLSPEDRLQMYDAIMAYMFDNTEPELQGTLAVIFDFIRPNLDTSKKRSVSGSISDDSNKTNQKKPKRNQTKSNEIKTETNETSHLHEEEVEVEEEVEGEREKEKNTPSTPSRGNREKFVPPTPEEVDAYCRERGNDIGGDEFVDFYASKGWFVGKNRMKDWKSAVRTWERNRGFKPQPREKPPDNERIEPYDPDAFERNDELYAAGYRIDDGYWVKVRDGT